MAADRLRRLKLADQRETTSTEGDEQAKFFTWALEDFRRFCATIDIIPKSGGRQKLKLNAIQEAYCAARTARDVVLKPRQIGFTTLEQVRDVYHFLTVPGARVVATCQSITDHGPAKLLSTNYRVMFDSLRRAGLKLDFRTEANGEWVLPDRDASLRIVEAGASEAAANKKGRAGTITRCHLTETAFYEYAEETLNALLECVPGPEHGSEIVSESTPNGAVGVFHQQCEDAIAGRSGYKFHFYRWFEQAEYALPLDAGEVVEPQSDRQRWLVETSGVTREQLKWYQKKLAEKSGRQDLMDQEYASDPHTCFLVSGRSFFDGPTVGALLARAAEPTSKTEKGYLRTWLAPEPGKRYIIAADPSEGTGGDPGAAIVYRSDGQHCATIWGQLPPWEMARLLVVVAKLYNNALVVVERQNHGHAVLQAITREYKYPNVYVHQDDKLGWPTDVVTRPMVLDGLENAVRLGYWKSHDREILGEMRIFTVSDSGKPEAPKGKHDDLVMAAAIGWAVLCRRPVYRNFDNLPPR